MRFLDYILTIILCFAVGLMLGLLIANGTNTTCLQPPEVELGVGGF